MLAHLNAQSRGAASVPCHVFPHVEMLLMYFNSPTVYLLTLAMLMPFNPAVAGSVNFNVDAPVPTATSSTGRSLTPFPSPAENWKAEFSHDVVLVPMDDLVVPVRTKPTVTLISNEYGRFKFSANQASSVSRIPLVTFEHQDTAPLPFRPTLFISICGFRAELTSDGGGNCEWQKELDEQLQGVLVQYQYKHFAVDWDTHTALKSQVKDLGELVVDFLNARAFPWDVVIIGHSRGGIFAHELSRELVGKNNLKDLHTFLLDPTASGSPLGDVYPVKKYDAAPTMHYASLFYDGDPFFFQFSETGTAGDSDIEGYSNYGRADFLFSDSQSHGTFAFDWMESANAGFQRALADILARKSSGSFAIDGTSGMEVVRIEHGSAINFDGDVVFENDNVRIWGSFSIEDRPGTSVSIDATIGKDGIDIAGTTAVAASHVVISDQIISVSSNTMLGNYAASVTRESITASVTVFYLRADASLDPKEININLEIGPAEVDASVDTVDAVLPFVCFGFC